MIQIFRAFYTFIAVNVDLVNNIRTYLFTVTH